MTRSKKAVLTIVLLASKVSASCSADVPTAASPAAASGARPPPTLQSLRIRNIGAADVAGLVVMFPGERVVFGNVPAGVTTTHKNFDKGVFRYAAYDHRVGADTISQPVIDWVGEQPMEGQAFTYSIEVVEGSPRGPNHAGVTIHLVSTARDR